MTAISAPEPHTTVPTHLLARLIERCLDPQQNIAAFITAATAATSEDAPPRVGAPWPGQGGVYAGIVRGEPGEPDYHLILAQWAPDDATRTWADAKRWAAGLEHIEAPPNEYRLPTRRELSILYGNLGDQFKREWYWSSEQYAGDAAYAWCQNFAYGNQDSTHKGFKLRARAVRRIPIR